MQPTERYLNRVRFPPDHRCHMRSQTATSRPKRVPQAKLERHLGRSSGFRIGLLAAPSRTSSSVASAAFVPGYSGGTATDSHRLPYSPEATRPEHPCRTASYRLPMTLQPSGLKNPPAERLTPTMTSHFGDGVRQPGDLASAIDAGECAGGRRQELVASQELVAVLDLHG